LNCYIGFSSLETLAIEQLKLRALCSLLSAQSDGGVTPNNIHDSIQRIERLLKSDSNLKADKFTSTIISQCANITRVSLLLAFIGKLIKEETDLKVITSSSIRGISATIDSPVNGTFKWTVEIGHMIKVRGSFRGPLTPVDRLCLRVKYGIDQSQLFFVKEDDLTRVDEQKWTFETKVRLTSSKTWSPAVKFDIQLCWVFNQTCFLGEIDANPEMNLLKLDARSYDGSSRNPSSVTHLC